MERLLLVLGDEGGLGGGLEFFLFLGFSDELEGAEFFELALAAANEAVFLDPQVAEIFGMDLADGVLAWLAGWWTQHAGFRGRVCCGRVR